MQIKHLVFNEQTKKLANSQNNTMTDKQQQISLIGEREQEREEQARKGRKIHVDMKQGFEEPRNRTKEATRTKNLNWEADKTGRLD